MAIMESLLEHSKYCATDSVRSLDDIEFYVMTRESTAGEQKWTSFRGKQLTMCLLDFDCDYPVVSSCVRVDENLNFTVHVDKVKLAKNALPIQCDQLTSFNMIDDLLLFLEEKHIQESRKPEISKSNLDFAISLIKSLPDYNESDVLKFVVEQLSLFTVPKNARRYESITMILACCLFTHSSSSYYALMKSNLLYLPHPRNLKKLISKYELTPATLDGSSGYLTGRIKHLAAHELLVNLVMDEIYVQPEMSFKGGQLYGASSTGSASSVLAKTAQVFMISSILSKYKDIVAIIPVCNMTSHHLKDMIISVIEIIEKIGFKVISVVSDNNAVNRKAMELLMPNGLLEPSIVHPLDSTREIFFIFDTVHIMKCIRNNWQTKKNEKRTLIYPDINDHDKMLTAQYSHLELMYNLEKENLVKYGHTLNHKVLYPSSIQKQNVKLALKLFNENNVVALKHVARDHPLAFETDVETTCNFIDLIATWWKIVNVKSEVEGQRFNDQYREPIRESSNHHLTAFLSKFCHWLKIWRLKVREGEALSSQTFQAIILTTEAFLRLIPYLFSHYTIDYILLSKFQSDCLESRFGAYRQMSGANYYISYIQVLENERKLRFKNHILFASKNVEIPLVSLMATEEQTNSQPNLAAFLNVLENEFNVDSVPDDVMRVLVYIGGYAAKKVLWAKNCQICCHWLRLDKTVDVVLDDVYSFVLELDRGKLTLPSQQTIFAVATVWNVMFQLISEENKSKFVACGNQLQLVQKLSTIHLQRNIGIPFEDVCECEVTLYDKLTSVLLYASKIFLNNFVKVVNNIQSDAKNCKDKSRKVNKLGGNKM